MSLPSAVILNVDDNDAARYAKSRILQNVGYTLIEAGSGTEALSLARKHLPDLVLLDVRLPDIDGIEVCRQIKSDPALSGMMVLQLSVHATRSADKIKALGLGADNYLASAIEPGELVANVMALLRLGRVQQELAEKVRILEASEKRHAFQAQWSDLLRDLSAPEDIIFATCRLLGHHLGVSRVVCVEVDDSGETFFIRCDWAAPGTVSVAGKTKVTNDFGPEMVAFLKRGEVVVNHDIASDARSKDHIQAYNEIGVRSEILIPFVRTGQLRLVLAIHRALPYQWTPEEIALGQDMAERTWTAVEAACAQAELRDERDQSRAVLEGITEGFALLADDWTVIRVNKEGLRMTQRDREALIGRNHWEVFPELRDTEMEKLYLRVKETGQPGTVDQAYRFPDGTTGVVEIRAYPFPNGALAVFFRDITNRKEAEAKLREADRRKDEFLAMLAHELRNPLAPISAAAELLKLGRMDEARVRQTSEIIGRQVKHMTGLVDDLLDVSRVTRGSIELERAPVDMRRIVSDAVEQVSPLMQTRRHNLMLHVLNEAAIVSGDKKRLVQVISNLLTNAAKYTQEGGNIVLKAELQSEQIVLTVEDDGIGIDPTLLNRVFDLFTQAERTSDRSSGGLGLGLALVKRMVELHGGTVSCTSQGLGKGSQFTVTLPRLVGPSDRADRRASSRASVNHAFRLKIMVVDDNIDAAQMLAMFVEASGHIAVIEHDAKRALEVARIEQPDVCLLDIGLPDMDGNELAKRLRTQPETAKTILIAVTGYGQKQDRQKSLAAGFDHYLVKPVDTGRLITVLAAFGPAKTGLQE